MKGVIMNLGRLQNWAVGGAMTLATLGGISAYNSNKSSESVDSEAKKAVELFQKAHTVTNDTFVSKNKSPQKVSSDEILSLLALGAGIGSLILDSKTEEKYKKYCDDNFKDMKYFPKDYIVEALIKKIPADTIAKEVSWYNKKIDQLCQSNGIEPTQKNIKNLCSEYDLVAPDFNTDIN